ncbi:MAG: RnfABCDGE type electron transport complex subunit G [Oscillospiraceae bacterium]|nr:RnfABCDGE type electron transport complex subunit G [Oscillospiraceae bacterium]
MKQIIKLTLILFLICAVVAGVLGVINELTWQRIEMLEKEKTAKAYGKVLAAEGYEEVDFAAKGVEKVVEKVTVDKISKAVGAEGYVVELTFSGAQGNITLAVGVGADYRCTGISVIKHSETSGLGAVAASDSEKGVAFREQFIGEDAGIALKKAGGRIDALSGATITSRSVTHATSVAIRAVMALDQAA